MKNNNNTNLVNNDRYKSLVKRIAHHLMCRLPACVQVEDLIQAGMIGLIEASKNYDSTKGASFETYAGIRIRGSMLDEIRKIDWSPRSVHKNTRMISQAVKDIENETGRDAKNEEVIAKLGITKDQYYQMVQDTNNTKIFGFEDIGVSEDSINLDSDILNSTNEPFSKVELIYLKKDLAEQILTLPERERMVLALYYDEELNLREVGEILGVSESRVSQIHAQAMGKLQTKLKQKGIK